MGQLSTNPILQHGIPQLSNLYAPNMLFSQQKSQQVPRHIGQNIHQISQREQVNF